MTLNSHLAYREKYGILAAAQRLILSFTAFCAFLFQKHARVVFFIIIGVFFSLWSLGQTKRTWIPNSGGSWSTAGNWSPTGVPATNDTVVIGQSQTAAITGVPGVTLSALLVYGNCQLEPTNANQTITINKHLHIDGASSFTMGLLNGKMSLTLAATATGNIQGLFQQNGATPAGTFTCNGDLTIGAAGYIYGKGSFVLSSGATLRIASVNGITAGTANTGNIRVVGGRTYNAGAHYVFNGTAAQATGDGYPTALTGSLTIDNPGNTITLNGARTITTGSLKLMNGTLAASNLLTLGNSASAANASLQIKEGVFSGTLQGNNWYNLVYLGASKNTGPELLGNGLRNLTLNMDPAAVLSLVGSREIGGALTLTSGILSISTNNSFSLTSASANALSGGSAQSYIIGNLQRSVPAGAGVYSFPVGSMSSYAPVTLTFGAGTIAGSVAVTTRDGDNGDIMATNINAFRSVNRDWTVTTLGGTLLSTFGAKFSWSAQDQDPNFDYNNAVVAKYADNFWIYPSVSTRESNSIQVDTILGTGVFQIGKGCAFTKITTQPKNERICVGASALLTVEASGDNNGDFTYQWMKEGEPVNGAHGASFLANGIGNFSVLVSGECRSDVSQNAVVSYKLPTVVTMNPGTGTKCAGDLLNVGVSADGPVFYQWKKDGIDIPGATDSTFAVREIGRYSVEVVGDCGRATSEEADVDLYKPTRVLNQPTNVTITYGESTNFTILAEGTGTLSYKWQKQNSDTTLGIASVPETIQSATTDTLQLNKPDGTLDGTRYRCIVTGFCGDTATHWVILTINKAPLVITLDSVRKVYGDANPSFTVSYSGFVHDEAPGNSDLRGSVQFETEANELSPVGEYLVTPAIGNLASKNYHFEFVPGKLSVDKALLNVWADTLAKKYGELTPALTYSFSGFKNNEDAQAASVLGQPVLTTTAQDSSNAGSYDIVIEQGDLNAQNYDFQVNPGKLNITKAPLRVIADSKTRVYGDPNPTLTYTYNGFVLGQDLAASGIAGVPELSTEAIPTSTVGVYDIMPATGSLQSDNYDFVYEKSSLNVTPAPLRVTAAAVSKFYGNLNPVFAPAFSGWKNSESYGNSDVTGTPDLSTLAYELSDIGTYPIKVGAGSLKSSNYMFDIRPGTLTIAAAPCSSAGSLQVTDSCFGYPVKLTFVSTTPDAGPFTLVINDSVYRNIQSGAAFESGKLSESVPESIWSASTIVAEPAPSEVVPMVIPAAEVGLKFRANVAGQITGVRFYKFTANSGTHTGSLWTSNGTLLATATFDAETESGWQQVNFAQPITVTPGTTYIVSYYAPNGNYVVQPDAFGAKRISNISGTLTALYANDGGNGLIKAGEGGGFPTTVTGANYFVDVVFSSTNSLSRFNLTGIVSNLGCSQNKQPIASPTAKMWKFITLNIASKGLECMENKNGSITLVSSTCDGPIEYSIDSGATYQSSGSFANLGSGTYKIRVKDATGFYKDSTVKIGVETAVWTGAVNTDWGNAGNWNTGKVPTATTHVIIPATANRCTLNSDGVAASVQVAQGVTLRVQAKARLTMTGKCKQLPTQ